jgi:energy-coupling factor transporter ATP-binding protein EcfA2
MPESFQSQIRPSQINNLLERVSRKRFGKYLSKVVLKRVRGFIDQYVDFEFPVTALVGPNGGGKTTILGAAACAYKSVRPRLFFAKSGRFDDSMTDWRIEYELIDRDLNARDVLRRTAAFHSQKWSRDALDREVVFFGVSRTVPANERPELQKCISNRFTVDASHVLEIGQPIIEAVGRILGKDISGYTQVHVDQSGRISMLTGTVPSGPSYSEFHFGAGESSVIRMVMAIESLGDNSLILIEEIENGLHPVATIRIVEYLIEVASRKSAQAIFTTHSNDALKPLPFQGIWASIQSQVFQGKLDIAALRAIAGQIEARLAIFCEDEFACAWIIGVLRAQRGIALDGIEVHAMSGDGSAVQVNRFHNLSPATRFPSVCLIDGDSRQFESARDRVFRLPGGTPESVIFDQVMEMWSTCGGVLAVRLLKPFEEEGNIRRILEEVQTTNMDRHLLFSQIGRSLGFLPETTVRDAFISVWAEHRPEEVRVMIEPLYTFLPRSAS